MEDPCQKCGLREAEYVAPGVWCQVCWIDWWCEKPTRNMDAREAARFRRELRQDLRRWKKEDRRKEKRQRQQ